MYEVEVKARLEDRSKVENKLKELGCKFSEELHQVDYVFFPKGFVFPPPIGTPILRVRQSNDKYFFTLKISQSSRQDSIERELEIKEGEKMIEILNLLEWQPAPTVDKRRVKTNHRDMEVVLDRVDQLGEFIEVEKIVTHDNAADRVKVQSELFEFLATLGVPKSHAVIDGKYDIMLFEKLKT